MTKDEKLFKKYKARYSFIFNDKYLSDLLKQHFDSNGCFIVFMIALLNNKVEPRRIMAQLKINKDEWSELFCHLYKDEVIKSLYKKLEINAIIPLAQIIQSFDCFNPFINQFIEALKSHELNLNISEASIKQILKSVFGYLLYNSIECKIPYNFEQILLDPDYETKYLMVVNNTKLFAQAKQNIVLHCGDKINDLIVLLLGMNKKLNKDN